MFRQLEGIDLEDRHVDLSKDCNCFIRIVRAKICVRTTVLQGGWPVFYYIEWG